MKKSLLITGATGLLGQHLIAKALDEGYHVKGVRRSEKELSFLSQSQSERVEWLEGDILDVEFLHTNITNEDVVIHAAAIVSYSRKEQSLMYKTNVEGTANVVNACIQNKAQKFIYISSIAAIGKDKSGNDLDEQTKWEDGPHNSAYAVTKYYAELEAWRGFEEGLDGFVINPSVILGEGDWERSSSVIFQKVLGGISFYPVGNINYVDVNDVVSSAFKLHEEEVNHKRYICNGGTVSFKEFMEALATRFGVSKPHIQTGGWMLKLYAIVEGITSLFTGKPAAVTFESIKSIENFDAFSSQKLKVEMNFEFTNIEQTLDRVGSYYVEKYK